MFRCTLTISALLLLSGCSLLSGNSNEQTLTAIQQVESNIQHLNSKIDKKINGLETSLNLQNEYILNLESDLSNMSEEMTLARKQQQIIIKKLKKSFEPVSSVKTHKNTLTSYNSVYDHTLILGAKEWVTIDAIGKRFTARVDTGAATSSLNAVNMQEFERDGHKWVRFNLANNDKINDNEQWISAPIVRHVNVRQTSSDELQKRAVVELRVGLGSLNEKVLFTLADRSQMTHPILLGREFIKDIAIVDVSKEFLQTQ